MGRRELAALLSSFTLCIFAPAAEPPKGSSAEPATSIERYEVETHSDVAYRTDAGADPIRHKLDVYTPKGRKEFPVLMFVHGGTWSTGNKGLYMPLGLTFARLGIGTVVINYRLSPQVKHPAHIEDVAKAFAWTVENIGKYGGRADRIFLAGHSAGGHLVSLLALDETYLKAVGRSASDVHGVLAVSGVYSILPRIPVFHAIFGQDEEVCKKASPMTHVHAKAPPFLLVYAESEYKGLDTMAKDMHAALMKASCEVALKEIKDRNHISIIIGAIAATDALTVMMRDFVTSHSK